MTWHGWTRSKDEIVDSALLLMIMIALPLVGAAIAYVCPGRRAVFAVCISVIGLSALFAGMLAWLVFTGGPIRSPGGAFFVDALSAWHLCLLTLVFVTSTLYALVYFGEETARNNFSLRQARMFGALWLGACAAMTLVLVSNNLGIMWVGIEATTLLTSFLICLHRTKESLEAMWKYLLICSVGVALAFMGTLLLAAAARPLSLDASEMLLLTTLREHAGGLDPLLAKAAFVFLIIGYGTKAGLAPMHTWLPDAHSQAPTPLSALFSGFMLNASLYCVMRCLPIVESATGGTGWTRGLLLGLGLLSVGCAAAFMLFQKDVKRLLAYSSVEHIGIMSVGLGLGGLGVFAALFHSLNHSIAKTLSFFAAGRLGQLRGTHEIKTLRGMFAISPWWGSGLFVGLLTLIGVAPFAIFMSEFQMIKAAMDARAWFTLVIFLAGLAVVFIGVLTHLIGLAWDHSGANHPPCRPTPFLERLLIVVPIVLLLLLGVWMPEPLRAMLTAAADVVRTVAPLQPFVFGSGAL